jgi:hypothetical protein
MISHAVVVPNGTGSTEVASYPRRRWWPFRFPCLVALGVC